jgi:hypothetical protein
MDAGLLDTGYVSSITHHSIPSYPYPPSPLHNPRCRRRLRAYESFTPHRYRGHVTLRSVRTYELKSSPFERHDVTMGNKTRKCVCHVSQALNSNIRCIFIRERYDPCNVLAIRPYCTAVISHKLWPIIQSKHENLIGAPCAPRDQF